MNKFNILLVLGMLFFLMLIPLSPLGAQTWYVDDDHIECPDAEFSKIQDAINAASPKDTIVVCPGTYTENVIVNKDYLTIRSESGAECTIVQAINSTDHVFAVFGDYTIIEGFTLRDARATDQYYAAAGVYINAVYSSILNNIITENEKGIYLVSSSYISIKGNSIVNNQVNDFSDGIYMQYCNNIEIKDNFISNNLDEAIQTATRGEYITITNNVISDSGSYGIYISGEHITITNNVISGNGNDGVYLRTSASQFPDNWIEALTYSQDYIIENNIISSNEGNGIYLGTLPKANNIVCNIISSNQGSGIKFGGESITYYQYGQPILTIVSTQNNIKRNSLINNATGLYCRLSKNNRIYLNNFIDNSIHVISEDSDNFWNSTKVMTYTYQEEEYASHMGNYWDDYIGYDEDGNGIGDTPYNINSDTDEYALVEQWENYFVLCNGNFDHDNDVDGFDLSTFAIDFGRIDCLPDNPCSGDFDHDGDVDVEDLSMFVVEFGKTYCLPCILP